MSVLLVVIIAWVAIGVVSGIVMGRRGHSWFAWAVFGIVLGPIVIPMAMSNIRDERDAPSLTLAHGQPGSGRFHVVVGIDGSAESQAAVIAVLELFDGRIGQLTLAAVLDHDLLRTEWKSQEQETAEAGLAEAARAANAAGAGVAETVLLSGAPARALVEHAASEGADLIAIGSRGRGLSKTLLGSVATRLAASAPVPVLVVGDSPR